LGAKQFGPRGAGASLRWVWRAAGSGANHAAVAHVSLLLEECGLPARMAARMAALPGRELFYPLLGGVPRSGGVGSFINTGGGDAETLKGRGFGGRNNTQTTRSALLAGLNGSATEGGEK